MENLRKQSHGLVAFSHCSLNLFLRESDVHLIWRSLLQKHNKKLFDMCNLGEEFHLGAKRLEVLRECNRILDREDFWSCDQAQIWIFQSLSYIRHFFKTDTLTLDRWKFCIYIVWFKWCSDITDISPVERIQHLHIVFFKTSAVGRPSFIRTQELGFCLST